LITRIGEGSKIIICGDPMQSDIGKAKSGFMPMLQTFNDEESKQRGIQTFMFSKEDIVRSEILKFIVKKLEEVDFHV
jgi:phosphate starvation-inducible PhoH-like protein